MPIVSYNYCTQCAAPVAHRVPAGDQRVRAVCSRCGFVHYENPRIVVGCVAEYEGRILLCRRAIEPRRGFWTFPAGFLELGESLHEGTRRECQEEALARIELGSLLSVVNVLRAGQVHVTFRARLRTPDCGAGEESLEVGFYAEQAMPWDELAFQSGAIALRCYFADRKAGHEQTHFHDIDVGTPPGVWQNSGPAPG